MGKRPIAVFGTRHICVGHPLFEGQQPVHEEWSRGEQYRWYSTGKLEEAVAQGYDVYVVSIRPSFGPHDEWWRRLVDPSHVFNSDGLFAAMNGGDAMGAVFAPWRTLYGILGVPWDDAFSDFDDPATALSARHGIRDGSMFTGHQLLC